MRTPELNQLAVSTPAAGRGVTDSMRSTTQDPADYSTATWTPTRPRHTALAAVCIATGALAAAGCGGSQNTPVAAGTLTLTGDVADLGDGTCKGGTDSNGDLQLGTQVVVMDAAGKILGTGNVDRATKVSMACELHFSFPLSGASDNYQIAFSQHPQKAIVQEISNVNLTFG